MDAARDGDIDAAMRCELALLGIARPTPEQMAGAALRAWHRDDIRILSYDMRRKE